MDESGGRPVGELDEERFWALVGLVGDIREDDEPYAALVAELAGRPTDDILGFEETLARLLHQLDRRDLGEVFAKWSADDGETPFSEDGGFFLSADLFLYARCAVVVAGREAYREVLADVERVQPLLRWEQQDEELLSVAQEAYELATGLEWDHSTEYDYETWSNGPGWA
jgi:hypothetical protein